MRMSAQTTRVCAIPLELQVAMDVYLTPEGARSDGGRLGVEEILLGILYYKILLMIT